MRMRLRHRISILFFFGIFAAGGTALGYFYYFVYSPPLLAADRFMIAMERKDQEAIRKTIVMGVGLDSTKLREPNDSDVKMLLDEHFQRGRILDQRKREGKTRDFDYLVYRESDGQVYALVVTRLGDAYRIVIPERAMSSRHSYLWEFAWTN